MENNPTNPLWDTVDARVEDGTSLIAHPAVVGPYQITSVLGEGGMGTVYAAEQKFPIQRRVALKLIKMGMDTRDVIARFETERQSLALMNHPNIAQVFDAGAGSQGQPYFVMELVEGIPLTRYCDEHALSTSDRLGLFVQVCDAIQHAHTKGIIHRDIKPGNVLVTQIDGKAIPKVIDFGIAKAIDQEETERTLFYEKGRMVGTPEYMSPEQADSSARDIDARTDIYSLGGMLYELLSGMPPFDASTLRSRGFAEIQRIIREVEPGRPSTRISKLPDATATMLAEKRQETAAALASTLGRELEWIPLMAMRKDREQRYRTASELADDVRKYLTGMPLIAGPETRIYLARKFLRRHRAGVATTAVVFIAVVAGVVVSAWQAARATRAEAAALTEKAVAERRFEDVKALSKRMLTDLLPDIDKLAGSTPAMRKLVDMSLQYLAELQAEQSSDVSLMEDVVRAYNWLGDVQGNPYTKNLGDIPAALESYNKAIQLEQKLLSIDPKSAFAINSMGTTELKIGDALSGLGKRAESVTHYLRAKELYAKSTAISPELLASWVNPIIAEQRLATAQLNMGETKGPLQSLTNNLAAARKLVEKFPASDEAKLTLLDAIRELATAQTQIGANKDAKASLLDEINLREAMLKTDPDDVHYQRDLAHALLELAYLQMIHFDDFTSSEPLVNRSVDLYQHGYDTDPADSSALIALARSLNLQKDLFMNTHRQDAALKSTQRAIDLLQRGLTFSPGDSKIEQNLIVAWGSLADVYEKQGNLVEALKIRRLAADQLIPLVNADPDNKAIQAGLGFMRFHTAQTMFLLKDDVSAMTEARAAVAIFTTLLAQNPDNSIYRENLTAARRTLVSALNGAAEDSKIPDQQRQSYRNESKKLGSEAASRSP